MVETVRRDVAARRHARVVDREGPQGAAAGRQRHVQRRGLLREAEVRDAVIAVPDGEAAAVDAARARGESGRAQVFNRDRGTGSLNDV